MIFNQKINRIFLTDDEKLVLNLPTVADFNREPAEVIETDDFVIMNSDAGTV
jgi:hypothetical protein